MPHLLERRAELPLGTADVQYPTRGWGHRPQEGLVATGVVSGFLGQRLEHSRVGGRISPGGPAAPSPIPTVLVVASARYRDAASNLPRSRPASAVHRGSRGADRSR